MTTTIHDLRTWKTEGKRWVMLTAYDAPTARDPRRAGVPVLLVGDSVANNVLGFEDTLPVTMEQMLHHTRRSREAPSARWWWPTCRSSRTRSRSTKVCETPGASSRRPAPHAVKIEGPQHDLIHRLVDLGIPVMAHIGLTPQSVHGMGGYRVQGRGEEAARKLLDQADRWRRPARSRSCVEGVPARARDRDHRRAARSRRSASAPARGTDAQVLVINDLLGINETVPKLAKKYADVRGVMTEAVTAFVRDVESGAFPDDGPLLLLGSPGRAGPPA